MTSITQRCVEHGAARRSAVPLCTAIAAAALLAVGGCGVVNDVRNVAHAMRSNKETLDAFSNTMKAHTPAIFEATYVTTGGSPTTVVYAVKPPAGLTFRSTAASSTTGGMGAVDIVVNASGEYSCSGAAPTSGSRAKAVPACRKLQAVNATDENKIFAFYTPSHWIAFLKGFSLAAAFAGDSVSSSSKSVNGFSMKCVDLHAPGTPGTSTICTTNQGILGYVKVASDAASFELKRFSSSPPASLFELPAGAKIT